jgi:hypothetical protein
MDGFGSSWTALTLPLDLISDAGPVQVNLWLMLVLGAGFLWLTYVTCKVLILLIKKHTLNLHRRYIVYLANAGLASRHDLETTRLDLELTQDFTEQLNQWVRTGRHSYTPPKPQESRKAAPAKSPRKIADKASKEPESVRVFFDACVVADPDSAIQALKFYHLYLERCTVDPVTDKKFYSCARARYGKSVRRAGGMFYTGITIRDGKLRAVS